MTVCDISWIPGKPLASPCLSQHNGLDPDVGQSMCKRVVVLPDGQTGLTYHRTQMLHAPHLRLEETRAASSAWPGLANLQSLLHKPDICHY